MSAQIDNDLESALYLARDHVREAAKRVERQRKSVDGMKAYTDESRTKLARDVLCRMEEGLVQMERHLRFLEDKLASKNRLGEA